jgi:hypothetical protein
MDDENAGKLTGPVIGVEQSAQAISGWSSYVDGSGPAQPFLAAS